MLNNRHHASVHLCCLALLHLPGIDADQIFKDTISVRDSFYWLTHTFSHMRSVLRASHTIIQVSRLTLDHVRCSLDNVDQNPTACHGACRRRWGGAAELLLLSCFPQRTAPSCALLIMQTTTTADAACEISRNFQYADALFAGGGGDPNIRCGTDWNETASHPQCATYSGRYLVCLAACLSPLPLLAMKWTADFEHLTRVAPFLAVRQIHDQPNDHWVLQRPGAGRLVVSGGLSGLSVLLLSIMRPN